MSSSGSVANTATTPLVGPSAEIWAGSAVTPLITGAPLNTAETLALPTPFALLVTVITKVALLPRPRTSLTMRVIEQLPSA